MVLHEGFEENEERQDQCAPFLEEDHGEEDQTVGQKPVCPKVHGFRSPIHEVFREFRLVG